MTVPAKPFVLFHNGGVGDFLMFIFLSQQLYASGVASRITIVVPRAGAFLRGLLEEYPYIELAEVSRRRPGVVVPLLRGALKPTGVIMHPTIGRIPLRLKLLAWCITRARGSVLLGFADRGPLCRLLYTKVLPYDTERNYTDIMRSTAKEAGATPDPNPPRISLPEVAGLRERYFDGQPYIVFHPGAGMSLRQRSFEGEDVLVLAKKILADHPELHIVLSGGPEEREWVEELAGRMGGRARALIGAPAAELGGLIAGARAYIGGDTGITHLACFVGARVIEAAHNGTAHWLCFYCPNAVVIYRLQGEQDVHTSEAYIKERAPGVLRPFGRVPAEAVLEYTERLLGSHGMIERR